MTYHHIVNYKNKKKVVCQKLLCIRETLYPNSKYCIKHTRVHKVEPSAQKEESHAKIGGKRLLGVAMYGKTLVALTD